MKKVIFALISMLHLFFISCTASKPIINNDQIFSSYQPPYKVFGIGYWKPGYSVLTLTDASHRYFVIKTVNVDSLKIGNEYRPR